MRSHLFPSRTQKLSSTAPMVLHWRRCGRVGHRRNSHISLDLVIEVFLFSFARFDLTRISINSASRFYKILLCKTDWLTERSAGSRSGRIVKCSCRLFVLCVAAVLPSGASKRSEAAKRAEADARKQSFMHCLQQCTFSGKLCAAKLTYRIANIAKVTPCAAAGCSRFAPRLGYISVYGTYIICVCNFVV